MAITKRYRNKKTYYQVELYIKGQRIITKSFSTKKEALIWHKQEKYNLTFNFKKSNNIHFSFKECVKMFWQDLLTRSTQSTLQAYDFSIKNYICVGPLLSLKVEEITSLRVIEWIQWLKHHPTSQNKRRKSFIRELNLLRAILNWYKNFLNESFSIPVTKKHKQICTLAGKVVRRPDYFMRADEARAWLQWLKDNNNNPVYWRLAIFMLLTGARVGEACGLTWDVVDFKTGMACITKKVRWDYKNKRAVLENFTKTTSSTRILLLPKKLQGILMEAKKQFVNNVVFTNSKNELLKYNAIQSAFNNGFKALKLPWRSTHICRHTYATWALMATHNLSAVQASLGHTEQRTTQRYAKVAALLSSDTGEKTAAILYDMD